MSNAAAVDAWLAANTEECIALHAKITPQQCEALRSRPDQADFHQGSISHGRGRPPACRTCAGLERQDERIAKEQTTMANAKKGTCRVCNRGKLTLPAMGMCGTCYSKHKAGEIDCEGNPVGEARKAAAANTSPDAQKGQNSDYPMPVVGNGYETTPTGKPERVATISTELRKEIAGKLESAEVESDQFAGLEFEAFQASRTEKLPVLGCDGSRFKINSSAYRAMGEPKFILAHLSTDGSALGLLPLQAVRPGSFTVSAKCKSYSIRCKALAKRLGKFTGLEMIESTAHGMWCVKLPEGK